VLHHPEGDRLAHGLGRRYLTAASESYATDVQLTLITLPSADAIN
jgi:hypothetical protein